MINPRAGSTAPTQGAPHGGPCHPPAVAWARKLVRYRGTQPVGLGFDGRRPLSLAIDA